MRTALRLTLTALAAALLGWFALEGPPPGNLVANRARDSLFVARARLGWGAPPVSDRIALVVIDHRTVSNQNLHKPLANWGPEHARVLRALGRGGATVVAFDLVIPYRDEAAVPGLAEMARAVLENRVVLGADMDEATGRLAVYDPRLLFAAGGGEAAEGVGIVRMPRDSDRLIRRMPFLQAGKGSPQPYLTLWFQGARRQLNLPVTTFAEAWTQRRSTLRLPGREVPLVGAAWMEPAENLLINYAGPAGTFPRVSYVEVLAHSEDLTWLRQRFQDRLIFLGVTVPDFQDFHFTPLEPLQSLQGPLIPEEGVEAMPGCEILANAANTMVTGAFLRLPPTGAALGWTLLVALAAALAGQSTRLRLPALLALLASTYAGPLAVFCQWGVQLPVAWPAGAVLLAFGGGLALRHATTDAQRRRLRDLFRRYVSDQVADLVVDDPRQAALGGKVSEVTVLFSDLNDFTTWSEKTPPEEVILTLNEYFTAMEEVIHRFGGTLKQFVGDEIMVVFGAPFPQANMEERAVRTALAMQVELGRLGQQWAARGTPRLQAKIGIHRGRVVTGNVGSPRRTEYAAVGDAVNLGSRVMNLTRSLGHLVLITEDVYQRVKDLVRVTEFPPQPVKGREQAVRVYGLDGLQEG